MTDTEIAAQANAIKQESNRIQEEYNRGYLTNQQIANDELRRHNEATESNENWKAQITKEYNEKYLSLLGEKNQFDMQLAAIEQDLKYANEDAKRELEKQSNAIQSRVVEINKEMAENTKWYNEQLVEVQREQNRINENYNQMKNILGGIQADTEFYRVQSEALYKQGTLQIQALQNQVREDELFWSNVWNATNSGIRRDELNSLDAYRNQEIQQRDKQRTADVVTGLLGSLTNVVGGIFRGAGGVVIESIARNAHRKALDKLFK